MLTAASLVRCSCLDRVVSGGGQESKSDTLNCCTSLLLVCCNNTSRCSFENDTAEPGSYHLGERVLLVSECMLLSQDSLNFGCRYFQGLLLFSEVYHIKIIIIIALACSPWIKHVLHSILYENRYTKHLNEKFQANHSEVSN